MKIIKNTIRTHYQKLTLNLSLTAIKTLKHKAREEGVTLDELIGRIIKERLKEVKSIS